MNPTLSKPESKPGLEQIQLLLRLRDTESSSTLKRRLTRATNADRHAALAHLAIRHPSDPTKLVAHGTVGEGQAFDAAYTLDAAPAGAQPLVERMALSLSSVRELIEPEHTAVLVGTEHTVVPGEHPIAIIYPIRRLVHMGQDKFCDYWLNTHARFGQTLEGVRGYRQFHVDQRRSAAAAQALGLGIADFSGVAWAYQASIADIREMLSRPEVAEEALEDEKNFIDLDRSGPMGVYMLEPLTDD